MYLNLQANQSRNRAGHGLDTCVALPERSCRLFSSSRFDATSSFHPRFFHLKSFHPKLSGFTLIELLVVISLLGLLAIGIVVALDGVGEDAQLQIARSEIAEVKKALQQFKRDTGRYPKQEHPADFSELILSPEVLGPDAEGNQLAEWNPDTARGWRGPYLSNEGNGYVVIGISLQKDGSGSPIAGTPHEKYRPGIADPFSYSPVVIGVNHYLEWLPCYSLDNPATAATCESKAHKSWGRPYYVFDLDDPRKARIVSSGPNGTYDAKVLDEDDVCADIFALDNGDDIILCLQ
jgi:prepilin-type N-terminal cleavage/methylation domain-containing protein